MLINRKFGDYVLLQRLAVGGQSEVYLALKVGPGDFLRPVVIKALPSRLRMDERFLRLFFKEAFISSRFAHPNVITVHDAKLIEDEYCLVMDFVAGQTVADIASRGFKTGRPLALNHVIQIIAEACDGLHYAHKFRDLDESSYPIVHCDISPQNLMVTYQGVTKVFDFGISFVPGYEDTNSTMTVGGKFAYMSPEQLRGEDIDARSDLFSLGIILYELCTGYRLFRRQSQAQVIKAVCEEEIKRPTELRPDLPMFLERCIMKALERDVTERYRNAAAMRDDLVQLLAMMSRGAERDELGAYVASLFVQERKGIADTLRQANQGLLTLGVGGNDSELAKLDREFSPFEEETMDLDSAALGLDVLRKSGEVASVSPGQRGSASSAGAGLEAKTRELETREQYAREENERLVTEVSQLQRRQTILMVLILVLLAVAVILGLMSFAGPDDGVPSAPPAALTTQ